ncbi:MAG TPA: alpha/beta hydrolase [Castellaniella sp.]|nr:alpha/beta hydrolase [Castellaniella sp.]
MHPDTDSTDPFLVQITPAQQRPLEIECRLISAQASDAPLLIFLHEGLGSVAMWRDWPEAFCRRAGVRGLVYSRYGYGRSTPRAHDERLDPDYLLIQARDHLPALLAALGLQDEHPLLFGHSDGGSIALLYAALYPARVRAIAAAAPHIFVEAQTLKAIAEVRQQYEPTGLRERLARYHDDPDSAFWAWNDAWSSPPFADWDIRSHLAQIRCPILAIQGDRDEYASLEQIYGIAREVPTAQTLVLPNCGHIPQKEQPELLEQGLLAWLARV